MVDFPRETVEYGFVTVTNGAATVVNGVDISIDLYTKTGVDPRPANWTPAILIDGKTAFPVRELARGRYAVWARFTAGDEKPVRLVGAFRIT